MSDVGGLLRRSVFRTRGRVLAVARAAMIVGSGCIMAALPSAVAQAHYVQPPGDREAAPAVVKIQTTFNYEITVQDQSTGRQATFNPAVPGPTGTGVIFNASGDIATTQWTALPPQAPAMIIAANTAFNTMHQLGWKTSAALGQRHRLPDAKLNKVLQDCYRDGPMCNVNFKGRSRQVVLNTQPVGSLEVVGRETISQGLAVLHTNADPSLTPTVATGDQPAPDSEFVAMGYSVSGQLTRSTGRLSKGTLNPAQVKELSTKFANGGEGAVLVDPSSKGTVIAFVIRSGTDAVRLVPPSAPLSSAGYRLDRGTLVNAIDQALGYFTGRHYSHAVPLLQDVVKRIPDRELLGYLATAKNLSGTAQDVSESMSMDQDAEQFWSSGTVLLLASVVVGCLVAGLVVLRRRSGRREDQLPSYDSEFDDEEVFGPPAPEPLPLMDQGDSPSGRPRQLQHAGQAGVPAKEAEQVDAQAEVSSSSTARYCPGCGTSLVAGDRFCYQCGTQAR